jgi:hypothetical protein
MANETARTNKDRGWTPKGPISGKMINCTARLRILADNLPSELREEANAIASAIAAEASRVDGLELATVN